LNRDKAMLDTNGYVFLDLDDPVCAWGAYRGVLVPSKATAERGSVSLWTASLGRRGRTDWLDLEFRLEQARKEGGYGDKASRLQGIYYFEELDSARRFSRESGLKHCSLSNLAEVHVGKSRGERFDLNWITYWRNHQDLSWMDRYWTQEPYPHAKPVWECLTEDRVVVLGTDLREVAYSNIKRKHPDSLAFLEIARIAAWLNSDLGNISPLLVRTEDGAELTFHMDFRDAENPTFLSAVERYMASGAPVNRRDISAQFSKDIFGCVPDLTFMKVRLSGVSA
jgi:hypothetical protein